MLNQCWTLGSPSAPVPQVTGQLRDESFEALNSYDLQRPQCPSSGLGPNAMEGTT